MKSSALGQFSQHQEKRLVGLIQRLGFGQCELVRALSGGGEFVGSQFRLPCTLPEVVLSPLPLELSCLLAGDASVCFIFLQTRTLAHE